MNADPDSPEKKEPAAGSVEDSLFMRACRLDPPASSAKLVDEIPVRGDMPS
jgi:hypothetical protein